MQASYQKVAAKASAVQINNQTPNPNKSRVLKQKQNNEPVKVYIRPTTANPTKPQKKLMSAVSNETR
jgi:hypothetical protein